MNGALTWKDLCDDKRFQDLPYKIELNGKGKIIMSPTANWHGNFAHKIGRLLEQLLPNGEVVVECAVETADGVKEADVAWISLERWEVVKDQISCSISPEICAEVLSESNSAFEMIAKKSLY